MSPFGTPKVVSISSLTRRRLLSSLRSRAWRSRLFVEVDNDWLSDTHEKCRIIVYGSGEIVAGGPGFRLDIEDVAAALDRLVCVWSDTGRPVAPSAAAA